MFAPRLESLLATSLLVAALAGCTDGADDQAVARDNDPPLASRDELFDGAPRTDEIPSEWKTDDVLPRTFDLRSTQSPVQNQARRGVCSIFSTVGLMEHLYLKAGAAMAPDFSEQYLQWAVKFELMAFTGSSGSNASFNLRAINELGIPVEAVWPYDPEPWTEANDPGCAGEDPLPLQCYTNGQPPAAAVSAEKFHLPRGRFISTRDIKANLFNRQQGVIADLDFFYQAWNHRKSTLPITAENWNAGVVLDPNEADVQVSLEERAGHSILLIGWDDDLEIPVRDKDGNTITGPDGNVVTEKGFYAFKNSWGTAGFGVEHPFGAGYGWISQKYVDDRASIRASDVPATVVPVEICGDAMDNDGDGTVDCDDADCAASCTGGPEMTFEGPSGQAIPDNDPAGVSAVLEVTEAGTIGALTVALSIDHTFRGDLRVTLTHAGKTVTLHDRAGGGADDLVLEVDAADFVGQDVRGEWRLAVVDTAAQDTGAIEAWSVTARVDP